MTSKDTWLGCGKDAPSFAAVYSGSIRILNIHVHVPFAPHVHV